MVKARRAFNCFLTVDECLIDLAKSDDGNRTRTATRMTGTKIRRLQHGRVRQ
jgi:hypothetical protein